MAKGRYCYKEVVPFTAMVILQSTEVGLNTVFKAATNNGMKYQIYIVYSYFLSGLLLLPFAFIFNRKKLPPLNLAFFGRIFLLSFVGFSAQMCGFKGIEYSSPTLASAIGNLTPAFTFGLAILFRMEKLDIKSISSQAKIVGTIVSIAGALVVVLYEGPRIIKTASPHTKLSALNSPQSNWIIGGFLLTADYLFISLWYILQAQTVVKYPAELLVVSLYNLCLSLIAAPVSYFMEPNLSSWTFNTKIMLISILYAGFYGYSVATVILTWLLRFKGPVYVALFTPLAIVIAVIMGVLFLGDSLYLGSVIGATIISVGFYAVMWGKIKEEVISDDSSSSLESPEIDPLLQ